MSAVKCRKYILKSHFSGMPKREDLEIVEETLPALQDGGGLSLELICVDLCSYGFHTFLVAVNWANSGSFHLLAQADSPSPCLVHAWYRALPRLECTACRAY